MPEQFDAKADGWETEVFSELASSQLKQLSQLLEDPSRIDVAHVHPLVAAQFTCGTLRPSKLKRIFEGPAIITDRGDDQITQTEDQDNQVYRGVDGLVQALRELVRPFADTANVRVTFNVFRINEHVTHTVTTHFFSASGRTNDTSLEQHATWDCEWSTASANEPPKLLSIVVRDFEQAQAKSPRLFSDCTEAVLAHNDSFKPQLMRGIFDWIGHIELTSGIGVSGHIGLAVGDVNGDELEDIYLCQTGGLPNRLFIQNPDGTATDRSAWAGVDWYDRTTSALLVDLDNDGDQDLVLATNPGVLIMSNDGTGQFQLRHSIRTILFASGLAAADYDLDGDLDLYVCRYNPLWFESKEIPNPIPYYDANNGAANHLLRNDDHWRFTDVTKHTGLDVNNTRWTFAAAWDDYDNDGDPDLYVANDYGRNSLYRNDRGRFIDVAENAGVEDVAAGMSVCWGDYNRDGLMDIYVGNMFSSAGNRIAFQPKFLPDLKADAKVQVQRMARGNTLFANNGDGTFVDLSLDAGVSMGRWSWGSIFVDLNHDGWEDLVVANGFLSAEDSGDL